MSIVESHVLFCYMNSVAEGQEPRFSTADVKFPRQYFLFSHCI